MDIFQNNSFRTSLRNLGNATANLSRVMRNDARIKNDYEEISRLNDRLKRIPIIPSVFGTDGVTFGSGLIMVVVVLDFLVSLEVLDLSVDGTTRMSRSYWSTVVLLLSSFLQKLQ